MKSLLLTLTILSALLTACDDTKSDPQPKCGDGIINIENDEECDGEYEGQDTCTSLGYYGGSITCTNQCLIDLSQCEAAGRCGDGIVNGDETPESCCEDTGCESGICSTSGEGCVDAWIPDCPQSDSCSDNQPWFCVDNSPPVYNCSNCGCSGDLICHQDICYEQTEIDNQRQNQILPMDQPLDWYFQLIDKIMDPTALTYDEFYQLATELLNADSRYTAVIMGESHGSADEQAVHMQLMLDLSAAGWEITGLGLEDNGGALLDATKTEELGFNTNTIPGDLSNTSYCEAATQATTDTLNTEEGIYLQYTGSGHTSRETSFWDMHWGISELPHTAECVLQVSRKALVLIAFDPDIWMTLTDQILMWRVGNSYSDSRQAVTSKLEQIITRWDSSFSNLQKESAYDTNLYDLDTNIRIIPGISRGDVWFAFIPRPNQEPWLTKGFQILWSDPDIQDFLWNNSIEPGNCSVSWNFTPGEELLTYHCSKDSNQLEAQVDPILWQILDYTTNQ
ncbi:MAG: hypothetical protein ACQES9_07710 [Myxococcota bacterium]